MKKLLTIFIFSFLYGVLYSDTSEISINKKEIAGIPPIKLPPVPPKD